MSETKELKTVIMVLLMVFVVAAVLIAVGAKTINDLDNELQMTKFELMGKNLEYERLLSSIPEYDDTDLINEDKFNTIFEALTTDDGTFIVDVDGSYSFETSNGESYIATIHFKKGDNINDFRGKFR